MTLTPARGHVLLVDDEPAYQRLGSSFLSKLGHRVTVAGDADEAVRAFEADRPHVVLLDLAMPPRMEPQAGLDLIPRFAPAVVVVLSGHGDRDLNLKAVELGAWDFLTKPIDPDMLGFVVARALHKARLEAELKQLRAQDADQDLGLIGQTQPMLNLRAMIRRVAPTHVSVIVLGPTGTGKELVARAIHHCSTRNDGPFSVINCGALSAELLESELFGHLKGSFTGAYRDQPGLVETAHAGTLFLDEVGEMPAPMQVKLLRFLQEGVYVPVGGRTPRQADVRIVAATHRDLEQMVRDGAFREDLYYRLKGMVLRTPALAERGVDIPMLAMRFLQRVAPKASMEPDALAWLRAQEWPGNVRQLRAVVEAAGALILPGSTQVSTELLRLASGDMQAIEETRAQPLPDKDGQQGFLDSALAELETRLIAEALGATGGNQSEAARRLGISRVGLIKKIGRLGLKGEGKPAG